MEATSEPLPIIGHYDPRVAAKVVEAAVQLATTLERDHPEFRVPDEFCSLVPTWLESAPTLHLDDLSAIPHLDAGADVRFYQERARLRAGNGDVVATSLPVADGYEEYCRQHLGLGSVRWIHPHPSRVPIRLAEACWEDDVVHTELVCRARAGDLLHVHPHMGTLPVWELAALLRDESRQPIKVIAPPPALSAWVNNKVSFSDLVRRLFGDEYVPRTMSAGNFATLADHVQELAASSTAIGIKLPNSAGGDGTVVFDASRFRSQPLEQTREDLIASLRTLDWDGRTELLVDSWETQILSSPSAQLWIPPRQMGGPIVEGLFAQVFEGDTGAFVGSAPAELSQHVAQEIVNRAWLLAMVFQRLGYVGRCSFDTILVGDNVEDARLELVECNGRWGGASSPMTMMNRIFGDWMRQPYVSKRCKVENLDSASFHEVIDAIRDMLYDKRTGRGRVIVTLPGRISERSAIDLITLGADVDDARQYLEEVVIPKIHAIATREPSP